MTQKALTLKCSLLLSCTAVCNTLSSGVYSTSSEKNRVGQVKVAINHNSLLGMILNIINALQTVTGHHGGFSVMFYPQPARVLNWYVKVISCLCATGEDLVSEQTCQREEDQQEKAATFTAGLHNNSHPTCSGWTHRGPPYRQPYDKLQHGVKCKIRGILAGFHMQDWDNIQRVNSASFLIGCPHWIIIHVNMVL